MYCRRCECGRKGTVVCSSLRVRLHRSAFRRQLLYRRVVSLTTNMSPTRSPRPWCRTLCSLSLLSSLLCSSSRRPTGTPNDTATPHNTYAHNTIAHEQETDRHNTSAEKERSGEEGIRQRAEKKQLTVSEAPVELSGNSCPLKCIPFLPHPTPLISLIDVYRRVRTALSPLSLHSSTPLVCSSLTSVRCHLSSIRIPLLTQRRRTHLTHPAATPFIRNFTTGTAQ